MVLRISRSRGAVALGFFAFSLLFVVAFINLYVFYAGKKHIIAPEQLQGRQAAVVLGAYVSPDG